MAYEHLALNPDISKRLAANRAASELNWRGRPTVSAAVGLRLDAGHRAAVASAPRAAAPVPTGRFTQSDIDRAVSAAVHSERCRVANVFGSAASQGRERICAKLLAHPAGWASSFIIAELPNPASGNAGAGGAGNSNPKAKVPAASKSAPTIDASQAWERSSDRVFGKAAAPATAASTDPWERAYATLGKKA